MSFNPLMTLLTAAVVPELEKAPTVIELGNQRLRPGNAALAALLERTAGSQRVDHDELRRLRGLPKQERLPLTQRFYEALGFSDYQAIDVNEKYGSLVMDLNSDLESHYGFRERFSLVTNNGTGEHVFNQYMVFKNIHALCRPGGWMIHVMPFESYVNHGFYSYHPGLYFDLAAANRYRLQLIGFANRKGYGVIGRAGGTDEAMPMTQRPVLLNADSIPLSDMLGKPDAREASLRGRIQRATLRLAGLGKGKRPTSRALTRALATTQRRTPTRKLLVFAVLEKCGDEPFRTPFQGIYSADIADGEMQQHYARD